MQISQEAGKVVWYSHLLNFPWFVVIYTVKGFDNLISVSPTFSKSSLNIWKFTVCVLLRAWLGEF